MSNDLSSLKIDKSLKDTGAERPHRARWIIAAIVAIALLAYYLRPTPPIAVTTVRVEAANTGTDHVVLNATGYIIAAHKIALAPKVVGRVSWVGVERADQVKAGQVLVRLEDDEYKARLLQAKGQLDSTKAHLEELENGSRPEEIAKALAELNAAKADFALTTARVERTRAAAQSKAISAIDLDEAVFREKSAEARVAALQAAYDLTTIGPRKEVIAAQRAQVEQAQGMLDLAKVDLDNTVIRAPISGTILERNVEVGEYVTTGFVGDRGAKGYVVSLADLADLRVELDISQDDFARIARDQRATVTTDAYPDRKYAGEVDLIAPEANRQKATVQVRVKILQPDDLLRPDMNASVAFLAAPNQAATPSIPSIVIPMSAVKDNAVFVVTGNTVTRRIVELGSPTPKGITVKSGVSLGDEIVTAPPEHLKDGSTISR